MVPDFFFFWILRLFEISFVAAVSSEPEPEPFYTVRGARQNVREMRESVEENTA